jgi:FG-GAP-like repeat/FG-GAP repeat
MLLARMSRYSRSTFRLTAFVAGLLTTGAEAPASASGPRAGRIFDNDRSASWLANVERSLVEKEYEWSENEQGLQAPNRSNSFRTYLDADGVRLVDRTAEGSPELAKVRIAAIGRGGRRAAVARGTVLTSGARVEIARPGGFREQFENTPEGLVQELTIAERPPGDGDLVVLFRVGTAVVERGQEGVVLLAPSHRRLAMQRLPVTDAAGRLLPSRLEAAGGSRVRFAVEDGAATYPLVLKSILSSTTDASLQSNQMGAQFGISVAAAGDVNGDGYADVIVGATFYDAGSTDEGAAFVFPGSASGITAFGDVSDAAATLQGDQGSARFGGKVAGAGDVNGDGYADVIVGAFGYDSGQANEGAAFVFLGSATGIASAGAAGAATTLQGNQGSAQFGIGVASAGDVNGDGYADVLVGANLYDAPESAEGAAFVFLGGASGVANGDPSSAATTLQSNQMDASFGASVASAGDVNGDGYADVLVGSPLYDNGLNNEGAAFVFLGSALGVSSGGPTSAAATLEGNQASAEFAVSLAGAGDVNGDGYADVVVGARSYDAGETDEGAAFVFLGGATGIGNGGPATAAATLQANNAGGNFGISVAMAGDVNGDGYADLLVGADLHDFGAGDEGAAFVYLGSASGIPSSPAPAAATLAGTQLGASYGGSVAAAGDLDGDGYADIVVGARFYDFGQTDEGVVFVYHGGAAGIPNGNPATAATALLGDQIFSGLGYSVAGAGDVNGDGYADVLVGAPGQSDGVANSGAAFAFLGGASGIAGTGPGSADTTLQSAQETSGFGIGVAGAGDVNGDGYSDVLVGAYTYDLGETDEGAVFVFLGSAAGIASGGPASAAATLQSNQAGAFFGASVAGAGDVNGDGYADIVVGANRYDSGHSDEGAVFVFLGSATGIVSGSVGSAATTLQGDQASAEFGISTAGAGDVNGDGFADVIVGADQYTPAGAAFVFLGSASGIASGGATNAATTKFGSQSGNHFGSSVAGAGDVNADGFADVLVGARSFSSAFSESGEGAAYLFLGAATGIAGGGAATTLQGNQASAELGGSVSGAGDVNGDGYADILVGARLYDLGESGEGAAFVFLGSSSGIASGGPANAAATLQGNQAGAQPAQLGWSVAAAGDVNGDGFADVIVGALRYDTGVLGADEGAAFVFLGNGSSGRPVLARQFRAGSAVPVQPWGSSAATDRFDSRMWSYHPEGGGRVKLQVEACPAGQDFGTGSCVTRTSSTWTPVTATTGASLVRQVTGLTSSKPYHWRARTLYAPAAVTQAGITGPPMPAHGPWRRLSGQAVEADIRTLSSGGFFTIPPCRTVDTRAGSGAPIGGPILTNGFVRLLGLGGLCGVPGSAFAVSANITAVSPTGPGSMVFYAAVGAPPSTSNISFNTGVNRANNTMLALNPAGQVQVLATVSNPSGADEVHLLVDVNGYFE